MAGQLQGIAGYRLEETVDEGERATVYSGREASAGQAGPAIAVKVLHAHAVHDGALVEAFMARAKLAAALRHPQVVGVHASGVADGRPWVAMDLIGGLAVERLRSARGKLRLKPEVGLAVLYDTLRALDAGAALTPAMTHGRLDAGCLMADGDGDIRVAGLGAHGDPQGDLLALGNVALELTDRWPPEMNAWIDRLRDGEAPFPSAGAALEALPLDVTPEGRKALGRAIKRKIRQREQAVAETSGTPTPPSEPVTRDASSRPPKPAPRPAAPSLEPSIRQARGVAWLCGALLIAALVAEVF